MLIASHCVGCRPYCPVGAIVTAPDGRHSTVDQDKCVECGACLRAVVCPVNAVVRPERRLRAHRVNVSMELGRPGISASFADVEVLSRAISPERLPLPACIFRKKTPSPT